mgnify:CR=1 FL=1
MQVVRIRVALEAWEGADSAEVLDKRPFGGGKDDFAQLPIPEKETRIRNIGREPAVVSMPPEVAEEAGSRSGDRW